MLKWAKNNFLFAKFISWYIVNSLVNGGTCTKGMTFSRDFHLLVYKLHVLLNGKTGQKGLTF